MLHRSMCALLMILLLASCGQPAANRASSPGSSSVEPVFAFSEAVVGRNRIALGLVRDGSPVNDPGAKVSLRFFNLDDTNPQPQQDTQATYYGAGLPVGYYVAYPTLDRPGNWGIEVQTQLSGETTVRKSQLRLPVLAESAVPNVGQPAISVKTSNAADVTDLAQISSAATPDPAMYQISLDEALASGKPTAVLFATPGFCRTATCAPSLDVLRGLQQTYGDQINFIHVEVYRYPFADSFQRINELAAQAQGQNRTITTDELRSGYAEAMVAWRLVTEPWLYLIDAEGTIAARYEGGITKEELSPALERLVAGEPVL